MKRLLSQEEDNELCKSEEENCRRYIPHVWSSPQFIKKLTPKFARKNKTTIEDNNSTSFIIRSGLTSYLQVILDLSCLNCKHQAPEPNFAHRMLHCLQRQLVTWKTRQTLRIQFLNFFFRTSMGERMVEAHQDKTNEEDISDSDDNADKQDHQLRIE